MGLAALGLLELFGLFALSSGLGWRLLRVLRVAIPDMAERCLLAAALGLGALQFVPFACFALGIGTAAVLRGAIGVLSLLLIGDIRDALRAVLQAFCRLLSVAGWRRAFLTALAVLLAVLLVHALGPVTDGDALDYHLTLPLRLLRAGRWVYVPTVTPTNWPSALEMLYALLLAVHLDSPIGVVPFLCGCLTLAAMAIYGRRLANSFVAVGAVALLMLYDGGSSVGFWQQMGTGMVDVGTTLFTTLAIFLLHAAQGPDPWPLLPKTGAALTPAPLPKTGEGRRENEGLFLSAVFAGLAATTKLTGVWVIVALAVVSIMTAKERNLREIIRRILTYGGVAFLVVLPWFVKTWAITGNPLYPMFYNHLGGIEWTPAGWPMYQRAHLIRNTPPNMPPTPSVLLVSHLVIGCIGLLICLIVLWRAWRSALRIPANAAAVFTACVCFANYFLPRFFMPVIPTVLLCIAYLFRNRERQLAIPGLVVFVVLLIGFVLRDRISLLTSLKVATGGMTREEYMRAAVYDYDITRYVNAHFSPETTVLVGDYDHDIALYQARALWPDCWLQDSIHYAPPERLEADMHRLNVTLLVLKTEFPDWCERSHYCRVRMQTETPALVELARRRGTPLFSANKFTLYTLDWMKPTKDETANR